MLLDVLPAALEHGLAFCRAVYHTSPMGDVVPVPGGLDQGLPDITVVPDLSSLTALPWEPMRLGDALDALAADTELADVLGGYFVSSFLAYKRNEIERFERYVTDWEFREYAYHL